MPKLLIFATMGLSLFARQLSAQPTSISLLPLFEQLGLSDGRMSGIEIKSCADIVTKRFSPKPGEMPLEERMVKIGRRAYPIKSFGYSPEQSLFFLSLNNSVLPNEHANLKNGFVVIKFENGRPKLQRLIDLKELVGANRDLYIKGFDIVDQRFLRVEYTSSTGTDNGYKRAYHFFHLELIDQPDLKEVSYDLQTLFDLEEEYADEFAVRAFSEHFYLYRKRVSGAYHHAAVFVDPTTMKIREIEGFPNDYELFSNFWHNPVDERDVFAENSPERVLIQTGIFNRDLQGWEKKSIQISLSGLVFDNRPLKSDFSVARTSSGILKKHANHPEYGYELLLPDGTIKPLTSRRFRLIHEQVTGEVLYGVSEVNQRTGEVFFHSIPIE